MPTHARSASPARRGASRIGRLLLAGIAVAALQTGPARADDVVLDQVAVDPDPDSGLYSLATDLTRAQTFTVGISGTLAYVGVKVSGGATATFEIHPTTGGVPVLGSTPLGSATVTFNLPSGTNFYVSLDFTASQIPVEVGDVLAIVSPGDLTIPVSGNWPFWHRLRSFTAYPGGGMFWNSASSPDAYDQSSTLDFGFETWVDPGTPVPGAVEFDASDRSTRSVLLHPESTPCPITGVDGLAHPDCERYAGEPDAAFAGSPIRGDIVSWAGDVATLVVPAAEIASYLTQHLGVVPIATSDMQLVFATNSSILVGGHLEGLPGDYFFTATLPTPQGPLDFTWWNRSQNDRGFEGPVLVGTAFEKRVVASCATQGDAPAPVDTNGICFLQGPASPGYGVLYKTLTAWAQKDATFPLEDYSPELEVLDFAITEDTTPEVPGLGGAGAAILALLIGALGHAPLAARRLRRPRAGVLLLAAAGSVWTLAAAETARADTYEGVLELGVSESFPTAGSPNADVRWHRTLRTDSGRIALPSVDSPPGFPHGARVVVEGTLEQGVLEPASITALTEPTGAPRMAPLAAVVPSTETLGEQRTLVTLLNFTNDTSQPYTVPQVHDLILDETEPTSTASYIREASYGKTWLAGGVAGWLPVGYADTSCQLWWAGGGAATLVAAMDPLIDFSAWDRWVIVIPPNANCGFVGYSSLGKETWSTADGTVQFSRIILNGTSASTPAVTAHELGHSIGALQHALDYECGGLVVDDECSVGSLATDRYDVIASTVDYGHYSAPNKEALHWLDTELVNVTGAGGTFFLEPYESQPAATKVLRIPVDWNLDDLHAASAYYVSYRTATGFDAIYPELATDGVMIHLDGDFYTPTVPPVVGSTRLLDLSPGSAPGQVADSADVILGVGQTFTDSVHGISIEVLGRIGSALQVSVSLAQSCGNGVADPNVGESCDGSDLAGETCDSLGFTGGTLACDASCGFDLAQCGPARCGPDHAFDEGTQTCTALLPLHPSERGLWRNLGTWSAARSATLAQGFSDEYGYLFLSNSESPSASILYRRTLPFDTGSIPDGATLVSASLRLKVLQTGFPTTNSHPMGADQIALVQPTLASPPVATLDDFEHFGSLDFPVEGAPRIDIGDLQNGQDFEAQFDLDATGLSWIDTTDISVFGLRGGFDVDDAPPPGQSLGFRVYLRGPESPVAGPRLTVTYQALPEPGVVLGTAVGALALAGLARRRRARASATRAE